MTSLNEEALDRGKIEPVHTGRSGGKSRRTLEKMNLELSFESIQVFLGKQAKKDEGAQGLRKRRS